MKTITTIILQLIIFNFTVFSQNSDSAKNKQDSTIGNYDRIYGQSDKIKTNSVFFSYAAGYSSLFPDDKMDNFWVHEASIGLIIKNHWVLSLKFEFWNSTYKYYYSPGTYLYQVIKYKSLGTILNAGYKHSFLKDKFSINGGIGIGEYHRSEGIEEYDHTSSYPTFSISGGASYHPANYISIDCKGSYHFLFALSGKGGKLKNIVNIKIGLTFYLNY